MTELTTKDKEFLRERWNKTFNRFREDWNRWENHTLKSYIEELAELADLQINAKILDISREDISSFLNKQFIQDGKDVSTRYIQEVLPNHFKRNYLESELNTQLNESSWVTITTEDPTILLEKDQFNDIRINGVPQVDRKEIKEVEDKPVREIPSPTFNDTTKSLYALEQTGSLIERIAHHMREDYMDSRDILDREFKGKLQFYVDQYAKHSNAKKSIDERGKWGDYEKIMSKFLMDTGETTAHMAELLNYSSKYGSIGIDRHGEFVDEQTKRFKKELLEFLMICPLCSKNIYHKINEQIEKYRKGIELEVRAAI